MKYFASTALSVAALCIGPAFTTTALADEPASPSAKLKLSQSECTNLWQQANPSGGTALTEEQAKPYVTDFKSANPDGDATIDQNEWIAACGKGLVSTSSSSGASTGAAGKSSDRTPGNPSPDRTPGASTAGAAGTEVGKTPEGTSDRTPK